MSAFLYKGKGYTQERVMHPIQRFFYLSPRFVRVLLWGIDDRRVLLPESNLFRYMRDAD